MSCQQASRFITNNNKHNNKNCKNILNNHKNSNSNSHSHTIIKGNRFARGVVVQQEDPYVFTESVPTTPPILFNTQKTRTRLNELTSTTALSIGKFQQQQQQKLPLTETNGKITTNLSKTQASFLSSSTATNTNSLVPTSKNTVTQSLTTATASASTTTANNCNNKKLTNVCIVRPQLQQQQPQQHHHQQQQQQHYVNSHLYEGDFKSISPPPLYTPPTPSLWQTPLLLESTTAAAPQVANVAPQPPLSTTTITTQSTSTIGSVTTTVQAVGCTTTTTNPSLSTTAMAKVAPIIVHTPLAPPPPPPPKQCLPPSKFHNHTLAQHLQKVECLKKSKKLTDTLPCNENHKSATPQLQLSSPLSPSKAASLKTVDSAASPVKHSENGDINTIPVNVIFRMAMVSQQQNEKSANNIQVMKPANNNVATPHTDTQTQPKSQIHCHPPPSPLPSPQFKTNVSMKLPVPALKPATATKQNIPQQVNMSSIKQQQQQQQSQPPQQQQNKNAVTKTTPLNCQEQHQTSTTNDNSKIPNSEPLTKDSIDDTKINANLKTKTSTHTSNKTRKFNGAFSTTNLSYDLPYDWQMGCSTIKGAVAIVKMSQHDIDLDMTHLATATGLPYCLQEYWLNSYDFHKPSTELSDKPLSRSLAREERIAVYKQQLYRQAMQLLFTRSLQKLPLQVARRRLLCVDRLLKKYQRNEQNKRVLPANVKRCCVNGCDAYTLEMASHCQQHIVYNSAQHVFLPCTAKFADNTQCRIPVFDITHDLPLCLEHARKRDAYNRLLYDQRPRKISTNPIVIKESLLPASKVSVINDGGQAGVIGRAQGSQHQQQHQHLQQRQMRQQQQSREEQNILQHSSIGNHSNGGGNKRPTFVNQQTRKRKMVATGTSAGNPVGRPQKRAKKILDKSVNNKEVAAANTTITNRQIPRLTPTSLKRKNSTTSLESITSNSQHSTSSNTSQQQQQQQRQKQLQQPQQHIYGVNSSCIANTTTTTSLPPPALAPLSSGIIGNGIPQHLFSFGHDNRNHHPNQNNKQQQQEHRQLCPININDKHSFTSSLATASTTVATTASTPTELKDFISQFSLLSQKQPDHTSDVNLLNTNSNSNFTSSGMGSTTSLPTADDFLTQDMLSICENSSASSADTGLGGLSDPELMLGGPEDDIPLGDTHLLEEHDLENVFNSLPEDAFKELFNTVHQDESDEIERAIELADKNLKTLQQTIGSELGDFLDFNDDMLIDNGDLCNGSTDAANSILDTSAFFMGNGTVTPLVPNAQQSGGGSVIGSADIRGLVQT